MTRVPSLQGTPAEAGCRQLLTEPCPNHRLWGKRDMAIVLRFGMTCYKGRENGASSVYAKILPKKKAEAHPENDQPTG